MIICYMTIAKCYNNGIISIATKEFCKGRKDDALKKVNDWVKR